ncbi:MAG TPA: thioesterase domain-containing protein, partial [Kofleriaceae bacterium]|nr:thioesterase domain-containing protein [Kofleriaceae bacterium]
LRYQRAPHSSMLDPHLPGFARTVAGIALRPPALPVASCVTGTWLTASDATDPEFWCRHLRHTVRFSDALSCALADRPRVVIEAGPAATLTALVRQHPASAGHPVLATLPPGAGQPPLTALGEAWLAGVEIDWPRFRAGERRRRVVLPTYSFERDRYWLDEVVPLAPAARPRAGAPAAPAAPAGSPAAPEQTPGPRTDTEQALVDCFHDVFRTGGIGIDDDFFALGGDSLLGLRLTAQIDRRLGRAVALKDLVEAPTVRALARRLGHDALPPGPSGSLVTLHAGSRGAPVFFLHAVGGHVVFYRELARAIDPGRTCYGLEARGLADPARCDRSVEDMAAHYLERIRSIQPRGPYLLIGASFGGVLAYEIGRRLSLDGHAVPLCALLDSPGPGYLPPPLVDDAGAVAELVSGGLTISAGELRGLAVEDQLRRVLDEAARRQVPLSFSTVEQGVHLLSVWRANHEALRAYAAPAWPDGELQYFRAAQRGPRDPDHPELAWIGRCGRVTVELAPGAHTTMVLPPHAAQLGARLRAYVDRAPAAIEPPRAGPGRPAVAGLEAGGAA